MADSNGTGEKKASKLEELHRLFKQNGGKPPPIAQTKKLVDDYKKAHAAKQAALKALDKASKDESAAVEALILAHGKQRLKIGGNVMVPMARGETVYLRAEGGGEVLDLG